MIIRSQNIECDVFTQTAKPVHFVQGEKGREIMFTFVNSAIPIEDEPQPIPLSGLTATIHILKPDGNFIIDRMTISGNAALYTLTDNACAAGGAGVYDVSLSRGTDVVYTAHGAYVGDFRAISDDVVNSVSEAYGTIFPEGFQEKLVAGDNISIIDNVISALIEYSAGDNIQISPQHVISATDTRYTAGNNVQISEQNVISATDTRYTAGNGIAIDQNNEISVTGSQYSITRLFDGSSTLNFAPITLSDSWRNYDALYMIAMFNNEALTGGIIYKPILEVAVQNHFYNGTITFANTYAGLKPLSNDGVTLEPYAPSGSNINGIYAVYGIKF